MIETAKGVRDFPAEETIIRNEMMNKIITVFENYGFSPLETPTIERFSTLSAKFAAGDESDALKETFTFTDQGERKLGLRFDLTVPLSRFIAMNPTLKMPFKRYEIGKVFRDGPIKLGRYREFVQCDVDIIGCKTMRAEAELLLLALDVFKELDIDAYVEVNNRKLLSGILDTVGITQSHESVITILDKMSKIGLAGVESELYNLGVAKEKTKQLTDIFDMRGDRHKILDGLKKIMTTDAGKQGIAELEELFSILKDFKDNIKLNISLARGLSYYTGTVFEGFIKNNKIKSSICGGGRYDNMIGLFAGNKEFPAVGISFGLEPITEFMKLTKLKINKTVTEIFIVPINTFQESLKIAQQLRKAGVNTEIDLLDKGVSKNLSYVNSLDIPHVLFIGEEELKKEKVKLRNMKTGKEELLTVELVIERLA
ncbi:histidine--tRNA ligase [Candidatus Woesearchaeota archaeon]|nr:MAG: histidine--tRNA ligase [Candidatus Woesearchaeota archaeon]